MHPHAQDITLTLKSQRDEPTPFLAEFWALYLLSVVGFIHFMFLDTTSVASPFLGIIQGTCLAILARVCLMSKSISTVWLSILFFSLAYLGVHFHEQPVRELVIESLRIKEWPLAFSSSLLFWGWGVVIVDLLYIFRQQFLNSSGFFKKWHQN